MNKETFDKRIEKYLKDPLLYYSKVRILYKIPRYVMFGLEYVCASQSTDLPLTLQIKRLVWQLCAAMMSWVGRWVELVVY